MKLKHLTYLLIFLSLNCFGQNKKFDSIWNADYIYSKDKKGIVITEQFQFERELNSFSAKHIQANKIVKSQEFLANKEGKDSLLLKEYRYNGNGFVISLKSYDLHGACDISDYTIDTDGNNLEMYSNRIKINESVYSNGKLIKEKRIYSNDYIISTEYYYANGLLTTEWNKKNDTVGCIIKYQYNLANQLISKVTQNKGDSEKLCYSYKYDYLGRKIFEEYKEKLTGWITTIKYENQGNTIIKTTTFQEGSKQECTITSKQINEIQEKTYEGNKLVSKSFNYFDLHGLIVESIFDARMSVKKIRKDKFIDFCGNQRLRYRRMKYEYDLNGNLISKREYSSPKRIESKTSYQYDKNGNLIHKTNRDSQRTVEWNYHYIYF